MSAAEVRYAQGYTSGSFVGGSVVALAAALNAYDRRMESIALIVVFVVFLVCTARRKRTLPARPPCAPVPTDDDNAWPAGYQDPLRWSFLPSSGVCLANVPKATRTENDFCTVKALVMHKPTHEGHDGDYPYSWHLSGRKRTWEVRLQVQFKKIPANQLWVGIEMSKWQDFGRVTTSMYKVLVNMVRQVLGGDLYESAGDDPAAAPGEAEPTQWAVPWWAFDQFVVSQVGEEPDLGSDLSNVGSRRTDGLSSYCRAIRHLSDNISTDNVYTFCFWGVARFLDCMNWNVQLPGVNVSLNRFCGAPPVYFGMYELRRAADDDPRHLVSRKNYFCKVAMWTETVPPPKGVLTGLVGVTAAPPLAQRPETSRRPPAAPAGKPKAAPLRWLSYACCGSGGASAPPSTAK